MAKKVLIGMSGGVDSSVAAYLLKKQGYEVTGVTLIMFGCNNDSIADDAKKVAHKLGINHMTLRCDNEFSKHVTNYFCNEYINGRTPNPCIECNKHIKFGFMMEYAQKNGYDYIATGHYAHIEYDQTDNTYYITKAKYDNKDQTYVLYGIKKEYLPKILMPLWEYTKDEIREIAKKEIGMFIADKPDSMEICFVPDDDYKKYILQTTDYKPIPGSFTDKKGNIIGTHQGIINFTLGQRKGLGQSFGKPMFVINIDPETNNVVLGEKGDEYSIGLEADNINLFVCKDELTNITCKTRYSAKQSLCHIEFTSDSSVKIKFNEPQRAVTPGQSVVFYKGDRLLGGGIIKKVF